MEVDWVKLITGVVAAAGLVGGGAMGGSSYNKSEHRLQIAAEQAERDDMQRQVDSLTSAHERAVVRLQDAYQTSLQIIAESCR